MNYIFAQRYLFRARWQADTLRNCCPQRWCYSSLPICTLEEVSVLGAVKGIGNEHLWNRTMPPPWLQGLLPKCPPPTGQAYTGTPTLEPLRKKILLEGIQALQQKKQNGVLTCLQAFRLLLAWSGYGWLCSVTCLKASAAMASAVSWAIQYTCSCQKSVITICNQHLSKFSFWNFFVTFLTVLLGVLEALKWWDGGNQNFHTKITISLYYWALNIRRSVTLRLRILEKKTSPYICINTVLGRDLNCRFILFFGT